jgi:cysteine-rich repeat protein
LLSGVLCVDAAAAQLTSADQRCIAAFNQGLRKVAKAQSKVVKKCLADYASGRLAAATPEDCVRSDPKGRVDKALVKASAKTAQICGSTTPPFGVTEMNAAYARAALAQIDLAHETVARNLNTGLIGSAAGAACQAKVTDTLLNCADRRLREYLKCQKDAVRHGTATDAASLAAACLGVGPDPQPDPVGHILADCDSKIGASILQSCSTVDIGAAFGPCFATDANGATDCLRRESACQLCQLVNAADGLSRDCDLFDDGNGSNGSCGSECPDGIVQIDEGCDDNNTADGDGCSDHCTIEGGWACSGQPSVCTRKCGDGALDAGEACDDANTTNGDGCSSACDVENGYECSGSPSVCQKKCGNGTVNADNGEVCDDHNQSNGDGCSSTCQVEDGYNCVGTAPSVCTFVCGNGTFQPGETCDDNNAVAGDGCSHTCKIETGWLCSGVPSVCTPQCGDGLKKGGEACDDGNLLSGDGCSFLCQIEAGFQCSGAPSHCIPVCGDGFIRGFETCDDANTTNGDGCSGTFCLQEAGSTCLGQPSVCTPDCGDGNLDAGEECDDGGHVNNDGCHANCTIEAGYSCLGQPSLCFPTCGNGALDSGEQCDDGNAISRDGCSSGCRVESGWVCAAPGQPCNQYEVVIDSPPNGTFTTASTQLITGHYTLLNAGQVAITVNGVPAQTVNTAARTFSHTVTLSSTAVFNPVRVQLTNTSTGDHVNDRIVIISGQSVADGAYSLQSVAMRINDSGLDSLEPLVAGLAAGMLDIGTLLPAGTTLVNDQCFISVIGCWGSASVKIANPPPSFSSLQLFIDSQPGSVFGDIRINNLRIDVDIDGSGLVPDCGLRLTANQLRLTGNYTLEPAHNPTNDIDVNLITNPLGVQFSGFNHTFTSGLCDAPVIGDIIQAFLPDLESTATDAIRGFLSDPDGSGPNDSPIADAIETALAGISISGPVGEGLGLMFESPLFQVAEDASGITLGSDSRFTVSIGTGPGQCLPPPGAPDLTRSYSKTEAFPTFGATTPVGHVPYGLGIAISSSGFNQLLKGQVECGILRTSLTQIDLDGAGGSPPLNIDSSLLSLIVPEFALLPPGTPLRIDVAPTIAPIVTGNAGPAGELTELKLAQVLINIVQPGPETVWLSGALDARLGLNLTFDSSGLAIGLTPPQLSDITLAIIDNPLGANEAQVEAVLPALIQPLIPDLAGALSGFPLPTFFGLSLQGVEVSRQGQFLSLFANLAAAP